MSNQAIQQELTRIRKLKRASESEVELLRSDMEQGKLHIRISEEIKDDLAEALVEMYQLSYNSNIHTNYYTDGTQIYAEGANPLWHTWSEDNNFKVISVRDVLGDQQHSQRCWDDFSDQQIKEFLGAQYWEYWEQMKEDCDECENILYFLQEEYPDVYDEFISQQREIAQKFFLREIPDEYIVEINQ